MNYAPVANEPSIMWVRRLGSLVLETKRKVRALPGEQGELIICSSFKLAVEIARELDAAAAMAEEDAAAGGPGRRS